MSAIITDFLTGLANKIRSKLGTTITYTPAQAVAAIDDVYDKGVSDTKVGNASAADVLAGKTFTNASTVGAVGTMTNRGAVAQTIDTSNTVYTVPAGYHNGSGKVRVVTQTLAKDPSTTTVPVTPDTGKVLSYVKINAISPQRTNGSNATTMGRDNTGPYVYFNHGWWPKNNNTYGSYVRMTYAQAMKMIPTQAPTVTSSTSRQTVTPSTNNLLSQVIIEPVISSGTFTPTDTDRYTTACKLGDHVAYKFVNTKVCYDYGNEIGYFNGHVAGYKNAVATIGLYDWREGSFYQSSWDITLKSSRSGARYGFFVLVFQHSGIFSGVGEGANVSMISGGTMVGSNPSFQQDECRSENTTGYGGMVMTSRGVFTGTGGYIKMKINTVNMISGYWRIYIWGAD